MMLISDKNKMIIIVKLTYDPILLNWHSCYPEKLGYADFRTQYYIGYGPDITWILYYYLIRIAIIINILYNFTIFSPFIARYYYINEIILNKSSCKYLNYFNIN